MLLGIGMLMLYATYPEVWYSGDRLIYSLCSASISWDCQICSTNIHLVSENHHEMAFHISNPATIIIGNLSLLVILQNQT